MGSNEEVATPPCPVSQGRNLHLFRCHLAHYDFLSHFLYSVLSFDLRSSIALTISSNALPLALKSVGPF